MEPRYRTPRDLVAALQQRGPGARDQLWDLLRQPLARLLEQFSLRYGLTQNRERLIVYGLHAAEMYLRTRSLALEALTWTAFRGAVLLQIAKLAFQPFGGQGGALPGPHSLPESPVYYCQTFFLPHDRVGDYWFGGDWLAGWETSDGCLWVLIADVTGHGYRAYLLASALPGVWQTCWNQVQMPSPQPADLLAVMHRLLADCLPEGVFVECTLARLEPEGRVTVAPAGGSRLLLRCGAASRPDLVTLRGTWLGLHAPSTKDQRTWFLAEGDELLLGSDGVFDQLAGPRGDCVTELLDSLHEPAPLFDRVRDLLSRVLEKAPQRDDITMVLLRRRSPSREGLRSPQNASQMGNGHVPV
jgi:hypothetical protein